MASIQLWPLMLMIIIACWISNAIPKEHYHRYMLSDYRPQHSSKTQLDYKPVPRPSYPPERILKRGMEPLLENVGNNTKVNLHQLLVRIYAAKRFLCMGTLLTDQTVITAVSCFRERQIKNLTIKTSVNDVIPLHDLNEDFQHPLERSPLVMLLALKERVPKLNITTKLCEYPLRSNLKVELPTYIRKSSRVHNQVTVVLPLAECRQKLNDTEGTLLTDDMICVKNTKSTSGCQNTNGNPLIYDGQICGVNLLGHNCPKQMDVDLYASVVNEVAVQNKTLNDIIDGKIEDFML